MLLEKVLTTVLVFFFFLVGFVKATGLPKKIFEHQRESYFNEYRIGRKGIFFIGLWEMFGAISIIFVNHLISLIGAFAIFKVSLGATFYHMKHDTIKDAVPAITMLVLSATLVVIKVL